MAPFFLAILFALMAEAQSFQVIHDFAGGSDGAEPTFGLTIDRAGNLYGTTYEGNAGTGTAYKLAHKSGGWLLTPLYVFNVNSNGVIPYTAPTIGRDGKLYGTTAFGGLGPCSSLGQSGCGTIYTLQSPATFCRSVSCPWTETPIYKFSGGSDGANPYGGTLVFDQAGNIYGTAFNGGGGTCYGGCGVVYKLTPGSGGWTESVAYTFMGGSDGSHPWAGVTLDQAGNLYGTTSSGGDYGFGTVYQLSPAGSGWTKKTLYSFQFLTDGGNPYAGLIFDPSGNLYGATQYGGSGGGGTVFELAPSDGSWTFSTLYSFVNHGGGENNGPAANLVLDNAGNLYGTQAFGAAFELSPGVGDWTYTPLHIFSGLDGTSLRSNMVFDAAGNLYGTASTGGTGNPSNCYGSCGTVWQIAPH